MQKGNLSREQATAIVGEIAVLNVESENCEPTGRCGYNGSCQGDSLCEWSAGVRCEDKDGNDCTLVAYYYTTNEQDENIDLIDWEIEGFEII